MSNHSHESSHSDPLSMSNIEERLREPIERAQETAEKGLTKLADYVTKNPLRSMGIAVVVGFGVARLFQKIRA